MFYRNWDRVLPIQEIIDVAESAPNLEYIILEQDHSQLGR